MKRYIYIVISLISFIFLPSAARAAEYLVGLSPDAVSLCSADSLELEPVAPSVGVYSVPDQATAQRLLAAGLIDYIEEDVEVTLFDYTEDAYYPMQWNMLKCGIPAARTITRGSAEVLVGVVDSGLQSNHPDFADNILTGYSVLNNNSNVNDVVGHGTAVTGIIGAISGNGRGVAGIADNVRILPIHVTSTPTFSSSRLIKGIEYAINQGCDIINLSVGIPSSSYKNDISIALQSIIQRAYDENIIVISAVGNYGTTEYTYPAALDTVVGVGATDKDNLAAVFSQKNDSVYVCAPGASVPTTISYQNTISNTYISLGYSYVSGTSFAAPHVAALAALARSINPNLTPDEFMQLLRNTSIDLGAAGYDTSYGYGMVDMAALLNETEIDMLAKLDPDLPKSRLLSGISSYSPNDTLAGIMRNNTEQAISGTVITAFYDEHGGMAAAPTVQTLTMEPYSRIADPIIPPDCRFVRRFVWSDLTNTVPLTTVREKIVE